MMNECEYASTAISSSVSPKVVPVYFVQSPSRDSNEDADKSSSNSMQNTPVYLSPTDSPSHSSSYGRHSSRGSSSTRLSGNFRFLRGNYNRKRYGKCSVIEEDVDYDDMNGGSSRVCQILIGVMVFGVFFTCFCFVLWGASRPYPPLISMKALWVHNFYYGQGSDYTGVPTKLLTINCSVSMAIQNPATFFGIHVSSNPVKLFFSEITVATGQLDEYYQPKKSERSMFVNLEGRRVPLYGAGFALMESDSSKGVPLKLELEVLAQGYLVGKLVKTKHRKHISCSLLITSRGTMELKFEQDSCIFD